MGYRTGLVAVDLPEESSQVLDAAGLVTDRNSATLQLLTVIKPLIQVYGGLDMAPIAMGTVSFEDEAPAQARQQLVNPAGNQAVAEDGHSKPRNQEIGRFAARRSHRRWQPWAPRTWPTAGSQGE